MVGGLLVSQVLTLFTTPVVYIYMDKLSEFISRRPKGAWAKGVPGLADKGVPSLAE